MSDDRDLLQGSWTVAELEVDGQPAPSLGDAHVVIKGNRFTTSGMGAEYKGTLEIDASKSPRQLNMNFDAGPEKGNVNLAIYKLDGDTWTMCIATQGKLRPKRFATRPGTGFVLETLTRGKGPAVKKKPTPKKTTQPRTEFEGEWKLVSAVMNGVAMGDSTIQWVKRVTEGNQTTVYAGPQVMLRVDFKTDCTKSPKAIDYVNSAGANEGKMQLGIYEFKGERLTFCVAAPGKPRPKKFESKKGDGSTLTTWTQA